MNPHWILDFHQELGNLPTMARARTKTKIRLTVYWCLNMKNRQRKETHMGLSENSVPLNPMINDHNPY